MKSLYGQETNAAKVQQFFEIRKFSRCFFTAQHKKMPEQCRALKNMSFED